MEEVHQFVHLDNRTEEKNCSRHDTTNHMSALSGGIVSNLDTKMNSVFHLIGKHEIPEIKITKIQILVFCIYIVLYSLRLYFEKILNEANF